MFCERIKSLRLSYGLNQVECAKKLNVAKQSVSNWENNNIMPSIDMLIKISELFSVSTDYILGMEEKRTIDVSGIPSEQVAHLQEIVNDLKKIQDSQIRYF